MDKTVRVLSPIMGLWTILALLFLNLFDVSIGHMGFDRYGGVILRGLLTVSWFVELVDDHSNDKISYEQRSNDHKDYKEPNPARAVVLDWLHVYSVCIDADVRHSRPSLCCSEDEKGSHCVNNVVEVGVILNPSTFSVLIEAVLLRYDGSIVIWATPVLAFEKTHSNNRENYES